MNDKIKTIWTDADFEDMNWHDNVVHALSIIPKEYDYELLLDIDYIFDWVKPEPPHNYYSFVVAPATLSFTGVWDIETNIATRKSVLEPLIISEIRRANQRNVNNDDYILWDWVIILEQGTIKFTAPCYSQYIRRNPKHYETHVLEVEHRGPISFSKEYTDIQRGHT